MKSLHNEVRCRQLPLLSLGVDNSGVWPVSECQEYNNNNHEGHVPLQLHYYYSILFCSLAFYTRVLVVSSNQLCIPNIGVVFLWILGIE
jgi:hypothetical protein